MSTISPAEVLTYANLSNAAYGKGAVPMGWTLLKTSEQVLPISDTGFDAIALRNETTGEIVVAYRGTDGIKDLTSSDMQLALQNDVPKQYNDARAFYKAISDEYGSNITVTGHSLGGALAQLVAAIEGKTAYTYNAPGVESIYHNLDGANPDAPVSTFGNINNYNMAFDAVSTRGVQLGNITNYDPSSLEGLQFFFGIVGAVANPSLGALIFGSTILGQHYIDRLEEAIATPKPINTLEGYDYDAASNSWSKPSDEGSPAVLADAETAGRLTTTRNANIQYNDQVDQAHALLVEQQNWRAVTEPLRERYGQIWTDYDPDYDEIGWLRDTKGNYVAQFQIVEENGQKLLKVLGEGGQTVNLTDGAISGIGTLFRNIASGATTLLNGVSTYGPSVIDALSIIKAIQSGDPLPITVSGLRLANDLSNLSGSPNLNLSGASNVASGVLSLVSLDAALEHGDTLGAVTAGAQALSLGAQAFADFAANSTLMAGTMEEAVATQLAFNEAQGLASSIGEALPYLNLVNSIANGDEVGAAVAVISFQFPPIGVAYAVYSMVSSLFGDDDVPDPWGNGQFVWDGNGITYRAVGETGGDQAVGNVMQSVLASMNALIAQQQQQSPGSQLGIIPNRMPGVAEDMSGLRYVSIDPLTGEELHPALRFDTSGRPYNAEPGSPESYQSIVEGVVRSALSRGAIAPLWEVQTAKAQTDAGDPEAGLTEEERAARNGQLAAPITGSTQIFRPVALDLDGDGIETTDRAQGVAFDVDDSGYLKQTAWVKGDDAMLVLDSDYNGQFDSGRELFSNGTVALGQRGLAGMAWVDANYDGKLTAADPVWSELKVWRDLDQDGTQDAGEVQGLDALGVTELNYAMGTFTQNGAKKQLASPDLEADQDGTRVTNIPEGILVQASADGRLSLLVTRIDDKTPVEANRDGIAGYEDVEIIVNSADLLANDTLGGVLGRDLTITGLTNFRHGTGFVDSNGFVHFTPEPNYSGDGAGFDYVARAANGQEGIAGVDITLQNTNDAPTLDHVDHTGQPVYGYTPIQYTVADEWGSGGGQYASGGNPIYVPYAIRRDEIFYGDSVEYVDTIVYDPPPGQRNLQYHTTPIWTEDTGDGRVGGVDIDDPSSSLTYEIVNQPQYGEVSLNPDGSFQYTGWKEPGVPSDHIVVDGQYAGVKDGTLYTQNNLPDQAVYPTSDVFEVRITDPHGASTIQSITVPHYGPYLPPTPPGGGGGKKPIAVDLSGNGFEFVNVDDSNVFFDVNGDGWKRRTSWVGQGDGLLAYDIDGDGKIDKAGEINFARYKEGAQSDLEGLAAFDSNGDGRFTAADEKWAKFGVWQDANQNGVTDPGEFRALTEMGVAAVNLTSDGQFAVVNGQSVRGVGSMEMTDGSQLAIADVALAYSNETQVAQSDGTTVTVPSSRFSPSGEEIDGTEGKDLILGKSGNNIIKGFGGDDVIFEDGGNDVIDGGDGNDLIYAGADNDLAMGGNGDDVIYAGLGNDLVFGGDGHDAIFAEGGNDVVFGGAGNDLISGGWGNDVLSGDDGDDQVYGEAGNDALFGRDGNDELSGMDGDDYLDGGTGNDLLDGGAGVDTMLGGIGDDVYVVDNAGDIVTESADQGTDTVRTNLDGYVLGASFENLTLTGSANLSGVGNDLDNVLTGNLGDNILIGGTGNDVLDGGVGADTLIGGVGNDTYIVDKAADVVVEAAGEGIDTVKASVSRTLSANVENLTLIGTAAINAIGNELDNRLLGNAGDNSLDGGAGADYMAGGRGDDTYVLDQVGDVVGENANEGIDTVISDINYTLGTNIENLVLVGAAGLTGAGNGLANVLTGNIGNNLLDGGAGADTLAGGAGNDVYVVDNAGDTVIEDAIAGTDTVLSSVSYALAANVENLTLTGVADINATGNELANVLTGNAGNNTLDGAAGEDTMIGAGGDDIYYIDSAGDVVVEAIGEGYDTVRTTVRLTAPENVERIELLGGEDIDATGNALDNVLLGNSGANRLDGGLGGDTLIGGAGNDTYVVDDAGDTVIEDANSGTDTVLSSVSHALSANVEKLTLTGDADTSATGNELDNVLTGNIGNNLLDGGAGADAMAGGAGDDDYIVDNAADTVFEAAFGGIDTIYSSVSYVAPEQVENLTLTGNDNIDVGGNALNNRLIGNNAANALDGGAGADTLIGGMGNDTYIVDNAADVVVEAAGEGIDTVKASVSRALSANVENLVLIGTAAINATGNELDNVLIGNVGDNILDGGAGADYMAGGRGNDTYVVDDAGDTVIEDANAGTDTVLSSVSYALSANVENLTLTGDADTSAAGNELDNVLTGNAGSNLLDGGAGADTMAGGAGDDDYIVDNAADTVFEAASGGIDTIYSSVSYVVPEQVENLTLTGNDNIDAGGNELNNRLIGNNAANVLDGAAGDDTMIGAGGDDIYYVDSAGDVVVEAIGEGYDTVRTTVSLTASEDVERIELLGGEGINATGNALDNVLLGNSGANRLDGGLGGDTMIGGAGDDTYVVDDIGDTVVEDANAGTDTVLASVSYALSANVENLTLTGDADTSGTGNELDNVLTGNIGNNLLDGGAGADAMAGGAGDDDYIVDNAADTVFEAASGGIDTIYSSVSYVLPDQVENLTLTGDGNIDAGGNELNNRLIGNSGNNLISGEAGDDMLDGGQGDDVLIGGDGDDTYLVNVGDGLDRIEDSSGTDTVRFGIGLSLDNVALRVSREDGVYTAHVRMLNAGGCEQQDQGFDFAVTVDRYGRIASPIEQFEFADGSVKTFDDLLIKTRITYAMPWHTEAGRHGDNGHDNFDDPRNYIISSGSGGDYDVFFVDSRGHDDNIYAARDRLWNIDGDVRERQEFDLAVTFDPGGRITSPAQQFRFVDGSINSLDDLLIRTRVIYETTRSTDITTGRDDDIIIAGPHNDTIRSGTGNDIVFANSGGDVVYGEGGNDYLQGGTGDDTLDGGCGTDILAGSNGRDDLRDLGGNNALFGGQQDDRIEAGAGNDFIAGGMHDDTIQAGGGSNVIAFNAGDGRDVVLSGTGATDTLSLGGDIDQRDLTFTKSGQDLVLSTSHRSQITLKDWYASVDNQNVVTLQVVEATSVHHHGQSDSSGWEIDTFDFKALVEQFDVARTANPKPSRWSLMNRLLDAHLESSDSVALGGELATRYAAGGDSTISLTTAQDVLKDGAFGRQAQTVGGRLDTSICHYLLG